MTGDAAYLAHIRDAIDDIQSFTEDGRGAFEKSREKQYAVIRCFEIIGEATKHVSDNLKAGHSDIPWRRMAGMRDKLIHDYLGVDLALVWDSVESMSSLRQQVEEVLHKLDSQS